MDEVINTIRRIESKVKVIDPEDISQSLDDEERLHVGKELVIIGITLLILVFGMVFKKSLHATPYSVAEYAVFVAAFLLSGWKVLLTAAKNIVRGKIFDENFLMSLATIGAIVIHALPEAAGVMLFFKVGEFFEDLAVARSRKSIKSLLEIRSEFANLLSGESFEKVAPEEAGVGDTILVKPGERVPLDGEVLAGSSQVDTSALTGESVSRFVEQGDIILSGMIVMSGFLTVRVDKPYHESSVKKILELVENAIHKKADTEKFITTFARYYTPAVVFLALAIAFFPPLLLTGATFQEWIYRALVILVISCPCALVINIPLGYFGGIGGVSMALPYRPFSMRCGF
jgi:Cd2+/Zn2+-exporting ATPase